MDSVEGPVRIMFYLLAKRKCGNDGREKDVDRRSEYPANP